ncbi:MAG TPA: gamma-glutamylcyclotransferase [Opitutaceae bacterium]|nr:gamma-glutamylcyclotransferase [Opitutaceae bacterium]
MKRVLLAVNGTLMRGLELNSNLTQAGATFVEETTTEPIYRLWSIDDRYPAMVRVARQGAAISVEIWSVPAPGLAEILLHEPPGLSIGKVLLSGQRETLGVLAESILCQGAREITAYGGWRVFQAFMQTSSKKGDLRRPVKKTGPG